MENINRRNHDRDRRRIPSGWLYQPETTSRSHFARVYLKSVSLVFLRPRQDYPETMDEQPADITAYPVPAVSVARSE